MPYHKHRCKCIICRLSKSRGNAAETKLNRVRTHFKKCIIKQLKIKVRPRGYYLRKSFYTKNIYEDEMFTIFETKTYLLKCRECKQIKQAYAHIRRLCKDCSNLSYYKTNELAMWKSWGDCA